MQRLLPVKEELDLILVVDEEKEFFLHPKAAYAWHAMKGAAKKDGIQLCIFSAFRSAIRQKEIIENKRLKGFPESEIFRVSAPAGFSEHHSGRAIDMTTKGYSPLTETFEDSDAFYWLQQQALGFGFTLSYPRENNSGIAYEPWHWLHHTET
jgi:D-alanyl-D-alanine carboxypeptidase